MLIAVGSVKGSPGATSLSLAIAACWPDLRGCVVAECDPAGGALAARYGLSPSPGLVSLAAASAGHRDVWRSHTQAVWGDIPVLVAPANPVQARTALTALTTDSTTADSVFREAAASGHVVVADCGRLDPHSPVLPILSQAAITLVVSRAHSEDLVQLAAYRELFAQWTPHPALVITGPGYGSDDVARELRMPVFGALPNDERAAAVLCGRSTTTRGWLRSPLRRAASVIAAKLADLPSAPTAATPGEWRVPSDHHAVSQMSLPHQYFSRSLDSAASAAVVMKGV